MIDTLKIAIDTLGRLIPREDGSYLFLQEDTPFLSLTVSLGDILTIIGMGASFFAFWWQLSNSRKANRENLRSTWFLEVIVQPNIEMISKFYEDIIQTCDNETLNLSEKYKKSAPAITLNDELAKKQRELKNDIKTSLDHFIYILKASEPNVADNIETILDELVDIVTNHIDGYEDNSFSVKPKVLDNKQKFISELYKSWNR